MHEQSTSSGDGATEGMISLNANSRVFFTFFTQCILPWMMCFLGALFYLYEYYLRITPGIMAHDLQVAFHLNVEQLSLLSVYYYIAYAPMQLPVGMLMDRYGPRRLLTLACFACAAGAFIAGGAHHIVTASIGRFLVGFGSAFAFVGVLKLATIWLPPRYFAAVSGFTTAIGMLGAMAGNFILTSLVDTLGWRNTFHVSAAVGMLLTLVLFLVLRDNGSQATTGQRKPKQIKLSRFFRELWVLLMRWEVWVNGVIGALLFLPASAFAEMWGVVYLQDVFHFSKMHAAGAASMVFFGWVVGAPIAGLLSGWLKIRYRLLIGGALLSAIMIAIVIYGHHLSVPMVYACLLAYGFFSSVQVLVFAIGKDFVIPQLAATAIAVTNMLVMLGGVLFQPVIAILLDLAEPSVHVTDVSLFTRHDFHIALSVLPLSALISVGLAGILRYYKRREKHHLKRA